MKKQWKHKKTAPRNIIIGALIGTGILSSAIIKAESDLTKTLNDETTNLKQELDMMGYNILEESVEESGYIIGYNHAYYQTFYDINISNTITTKAEIYNNLENIYNGNDKSLYQKGLIEGIDDGTSKAYDDTNYKVKK